MGGIRLISPDPSLEKRGKNGEAPPLFKGRLGGIREIRRYKENMPKYFKGSMLFYNTKLKRRSQELRRNMTDAERLLWSRLRGKQPKGLQFYRQRIISNYIGDFYCPAAKLVIELEGGQHYTDKGVKEDRVRDGYLNSLGLKVLRFAHRDIVENLDGCLERICESL